MSVKLNRYPEYGVTLFVFSGALGVDDVALLCHMLDSRDCEKWLSYFDPTSDFSGIAVGQLPELKRALEKCQVEACGGVRQPNAMVVVSSAGENFARFWREYTLIGSVNPMTPTVFSDFRAACDWLGLPEAARAKFEAEVGFPELGALGG